MDSDDEFYQLIANKKLFRDNDCFKKSSKLDKVESTTASQSESQTQSDVFSLRFSGSNPDETEENSKQKHITIINISSSEDSTHFDDDNNRFIKHQDSSDYICESSDSELPKTPAKSAIEITEKVNSISKVKVREYNKSPVIIKESDSENEMEQNEPAMYKLIQDMVSENISLTEKKKSRIMEWLTTNFNNSKQDNSCSLESTIPESRRSGISSGNSSLERMELNFETPNNRDKFSRNNSSKKINKETQTEFDRENTIDKYNFNSKSKVGNNRAHDNDDSSTSTPINYVKAVRRKIILPESDSINSSESKNSNNTEEKRTNSLERRLLVDSDSSSKTINNNSDKKLKIFSKVIIPESESFESGTSESKNSKRTPNNNANSLEKKLIGKTDSSSKITSNNSDKKLKFHAKVTNLETDSFDTATSDRKVSKRTPKNTTNSLEKKLIAKSDSSSKTTGDNSYKKLKSHSKVTKPELDSFDSVTSERKVSEKTPKYDANSLERRLLTESNSSSEKTSNNSNKNLKFHQKVIIPESDSFDSYDNTELQNKFKNHKIDEGKKFDISPFREKIQASEHVSFTDDDDDDHDHDHEIIRGPKHVSLTEDEDSKCNDNIDLNLNDKENQVKERTPIKRNKTRDTITDCTDILANLYGEYWKNKASTLIAATEPKKKPTRKFFNEVQTEKKDNFLKPRFNNQGTTEEKRIKKLNEKTNSKKSKNIPKFEDSFINNSSSGESSLCSYHTALSNPVPFFQNQKLNVGTPSTMRDEDKKSERRKYNVCDSESDSDNLGCKNNQKKLSFDSSSDSSVTDIDPEDTVYPRKAVKNSNVQKVFNFKSDKDKPVKKSDVLIKKSFLDSLSNHVPLEKADFKAMVYRVKYDSMKDELCKVLFKLFNEKIFDNKLPDDLSLEWGSNLLTTAGFCKNKKSVRANGEIVRSSKIQLATKILDSPERLRDTLIHEMCHAATFLINHSEEQHGRIWKAWAQKAVQVFPELPSVSRCHNYEIQTKYTYKCTTCGHSIGRHSKSLDVNKKRCGYCHGKFELFINKTSKAGKVQKKVTGQEKKEPSGFALFVKENYSSIKKTKPHVTHAETMKILGEKFSSVKLNPEKNIHSKN